MEIPLSEVPLGWPAVVRRVDALPWVTQRLGELGLLEGTRVIPLFQSGSHDPTAYHFRQTVIALRGDMARQIVVTLENPDIP